MGLRSREDMVRPHPWYMYLGEGLLVSIFQAMCTGSISGKESRAYALGTSFMAQAASDITANLYATSM